MDDPKTFKLGTENDLGIAYRWYDFWSKVKVRIRIIIIIIVLYG